MTDLDAHLGTVRRAFEPGASADDRSAAIIVLRAALQLLEGKAPPLAVAPSSSTPALAPAALAKPDVIGLLLSAVQARLPEDKQREIAESLRDIPTIPIVPFPRV